MNGMRFSGPESLSMGGYGRSSNMPVTMDDGYYRKHHPTNPPALGMGQYRPMGGFGIGGSTEPMRMFPTSSPQSMMLGGRPGFDYPSPIGMTHIPTMDSANRGGLSKHRQEHSGFVADFDLNSYHHGGGGGGYNLYFNSQYEPPDDGPLEHLRQPPTIGKYAPHEREALLERFRKKRAERCYNRQVKYVSRKVLADNRPRVKGRFAKASGSAEEATTSAAAAAAAAGEGEGEVKEEMPSPSSGSSRPSETEPVSCDQPSGPASRSKLASAQGACEEKELKNVQKGSEEQPADADAGLILD